MIAIIDGDVLCYSACKPRYSKQALASGINIIELNDIGEVIPREFSDAENRKYLESSWDNFQRELQEIVESFFCDDFLMAVKGESNYRDRIFPEYKQKRTKPKPGDLRSYVPAIRQLSVLEELAIAADDREADDYVRIWAEECRAAGIEYVICSIDKDLKCIPGKHYNIKSKLVEEVTEEQALKFYYSQLISGDQTDGIPGVPGMGPVKSKGLIQTCSTESEMQEVVVSLYLAAFGEELWENALLANGKMIHIQRHLNDHFSVRDWAIVKELRL